MNISVQPAILQWSRERAGLNIAAMAKKLTTKPEQVRLWEEKGQLPWKKAEKLAKVTHIPFGYLFLQEPPVETLPIADFRTLGGQGAQRPSPELLDVLYDTIRKQDWYRDYLLELRAEPLAFVGSVSVSDNHIEVAETIRESLCLEESWRETSTSWTDALAFLFDACEQAGVLVMRSGVALGNPHRPLEVEEFRGFALTDAYAPVIFINSRDSAAAQMFTLVHELVHLWMGLSGVSNLEKTFAAGPREERFCNQVAAEILVPRDELRSLLVLKEPLEKLLPRLRRHFMVSTLVLLHRFRELGLIAPEVFQAAYDHEQQNFAEAKARQKSGGHYYNTQRARVSAPFARAVIGSALEGRTLYRDAYQLLGVKKEATFRKLAGHVQVEI
jgi:Zn-dependent peptidase ImmA (M78 family)